MEVQIRPAVADDEQVFLELSIGLSMFNRSHRDFGPQEKHLSERLHRNREIFRTESDQQLILIAEMAGEAVGYALCNYSEARDKLVGYIDELYVNDQTRGLGLGKRLMNMCIDWMKEKGIDRVTLNAFAFNEHALAFYRQQGFSIYAHSLEKQL